MSFCDEQRFEREFARGAARRLRKKSERRAPAPPGAVTAYAVTAQYNVKFYLFVVPIVVLRTCEFFFHLALTN